MTESSMTLYQINKMAYRQVPKMNELQFNQMMNNISLWFSSKEKTHYFMFLSKELSDYTIFHFNTYDYSKAREELVKLVNSRGIPVDIQYDHDTDTYDIWVRRISIDPITSKPTMDVVMYKMFECNDFIIEI